MKKVLIILMLLLSLLLMLVGCRWNEVADYEQSIEMCGVGMSIPANYEVQNDNELYKEFIKTDNNDKALEGVILVQNENNIETIKNKTEENIMASEDYEQNWGYIEINRVAISERHCYEMSYDENGRNNVLLLIPVEEGTLMISVFGEDEERCNEIIDTVEFVDQIACFHQIRIAV